MFLPPPVKHFCYTLVHGQITRQPNLGQMLLCPCGTDEGELNEEMQEISIQKVQINV